MPHKTAQRHNDSKAEALPSGLTQGYPARGEVFLASFWSRSQGRCRSPESREGSVGSSARHPGGNKTSPGAVPVFQIPRVSRAGLRAAQAPLSMEKSSVLTTLCSPACSKAVSKSKQKAKFLLRKALLGQALRLLSCIQAPGARMESRFLGTPHPDGSSQVMGLPPAPVSSQPRCRHCLQPHLSLSSLPAFQKQNQSPPEPHDLARAEHTSSDFQRWV